MKSTRKEKNLVSVHNLIGQLYTPRRDTNGAGGGKIVLTMKNLIQFLVIAFAIYLPVLQAGDYQLTAVEALITLVQPNAVD